MPRRRVPSDRPLAWLFWLLSLLFRLLFTAAFGLRFNKPEEIRRLRGPLVVIGNHPSYFDPFLTAAALFPWRINYVTSHSFFRNPVLRFLLGKLGAIPKIQFRSDLQAMKHMLRVIRSGGILGIYPEGQRSLDGGRQTVDEAIAKLVSKLGCPVVAVHDSGGYLTWPRWSQSRWRRGRIKVEISVLFTPEQLAGLDV
ncbi:MAG TPA: hypothetical protein DD640_00705, partial [Clostridiales bacterium]|nr:hypothetical protein [Clostridiales bacterium]